MTSNASFDTNRTTRNQRRGAVFVYAIMTMSVVVGFCSLAVDVGRVLVAKAQAQTAADAAAIYAADGLIGGTSTAAATRARTAAADNLVNGVPAVVNTSTDVVFGIWDSANKKFVVLGTGAQVGATAVQVTVNCTKARGNPVSMMFAQVLGIKTKDITATATAAIGQVTSKSVPAAACPWLAGAASSATVAATGGNNTPCNTTDNSPVAFAATAGTSIRFANAGGTTTWDPGAGTGSAGADGDSTYIAAQASCNGINTSKCPINAMVGIFLDANDPSTTAVNSVLDFSTAASRDFSTLSPGLKQVFFIGDGLNSAGQLQTFNVPTGATRLFIGTMDEKGWWWDNMGSLQFTAVVGNQAILVK